MAADSIGTRIRRARERKRWKQQQLADELGVSLRAVGDWENDRTYPRSSIGALEEVLGVDLSDRGRQERISKRARRLLREDLSPADYERVMDALREPPDDG